jgi:hypothetical protein
MCYDRYNKNPTVLCLPNREESSDALIPANLLYAVWNELDYMAGYQQQDAHEFLIAFLDGIDKHLRTNHATGNAGGLSIALPNPLQTSSYAAAGLEHSPVMRKSPRSESKPRPFTSGGSWTSPPLLRRSLSENEPTSTGSVHAVTQCAEVLDVSTPAARVWFLLSDDVRSPFMFSSGRTKGVPGVAAVKLDLQVLRARERQARGLPGS